MQNEEQMKNKTIFLYIFILTWIIPFGSVAQIDSISNRFKKEFNTFNQTIQQKHLSFRQENDSVFSQFLKDSWASFDVFYKGKPAEIKPVDQPKIARPTKEITIPSQEMSIDSSKFSNVKKPTETEPQVEKKEQPEPVENGGTVSLNVDFYGNESKLAYPLGIPQIHRISSESISDYFNQTCSSPSILRLVSELQNLKKKLQLNDWGYYQLVERCSAQLESDSSSKTLLTWVLLIKSGYNAKSGFSGNKIFLLLPFREDLFNNYYIRIDGQDYFIPSSGITAEEIRQITVHKADYPGNSMFSLMIAQLPNLGTKTINREFVFREKKLIVSESEQLINFYKDYPMCEMKVYFLSPLSGMVFRSLDNYFKPLFGGLTEKEKVAILLEFTQKAFSYQTDKDQFAREKYFFPDEIFYYPYSDCEDRAILFTKLVRHFTNLSCVGLDYPGHVNTAVSFNEDTKGTFITLKGEKYIICDPTYINAPIGLLPEEFRGITPKVITFE